MSVTTRSRIVGDSLEGSNDVWHLTSRQLTSGQGLATLAPNISPPTGLDSATHPANRLLRISLPTITAGRSVPPSAWVPHRANRTTTDHLAHNRAVTQCRAHGARLDCRIIFTTINNNLHNTVLYDLKTKYCYDPTVSHIQGDSGGMCTTLG